MNKKAERANMILKILMNKNGESLKELANALDVSEMTVRRDVNLLCEKKLVTLINGVAIYNHNTSSSILNKEYHLDTERDAHAEDKMRIGAMAASMLERNDIIVIDTGTTTECLAKHIPNNLNLTIVCYNMNILLEIKNKTNKIIMPGGHYHENTQMFQSPEGTSLIARTCANKAFISAAGVSSKLTVTCIDQYETNTKQAAIEAAEKKILLMDSSKFDKICPVAFANLEDFDAIVTDKSLSPEWVKFINSLEIELYLA